MIARNIQEKMCEIFMTLAELERNVEVTRQVLTENKDYNSYQIFCYLDTHKKNKLNASLQKLKSNYLFYFMILI